MTSAFLVSRAAWNTPSPAASAFWKMTSALRPICASACSLPALTSSQLPMYEVSTVTRGFTAFAPRVNAVEALLHRRQLGAADDAEDVRLRHAAGDHAGEIRGIGEGELDPGDVGAARGAGGGDVDRLREIGAHPLRGILELEAMAEDEVVSLRAVLPEVLLELGRRLGLDVADRGAEAIRMRMSPW